MLHDKKIYKVLGESHLGQANSYRPLTVLAAARPVHAVSCVKEEEEDRQFI